MLEQLLAQIKKEFPDFKLTPKTSSKLMVAINTFLFMITFGKMSSFMIGYVTTIDQTVYTPTTWDSMSDKGKAIVLRHERVHMRQSRRMGSYWFKFVYLVPIFPLWVALGRTRLEQEAYIETMSATLEYYGMSVITAASFKTWMVSQFTSADYGWMAFFSKKAIDSWYMDTLGKVIASQVKS